MKSKAPSYLRQLAQPVPVGGTMLSVPRRARERVGEKFGLAGVPVIQDAEETIVVPLLLRHVPIVVSEPRRESSKPVAEAGVAEPPPRRIVTSRVETSRPAAPFSKNPEGRLESKPKVKAIAAPREEAATVAPLKQRTIQEASVGRGERERLLSQEAVPQTSSKTGQTMEAAALTRSAEKRATEQKEAAKDAALETRREVLRVERERLIESEIRTLEAKPQRASRPTPQTEPKPAEQRASIHIGTVEVRIVTPAPPAPSPLQQRPVESQPSRLAPPASAPSLARSLAWNYGLVQG